MENPAIAVVVPVYNAKKFLKKCVRSVQKQTFKNWKMILVDDGSSDGSDLLCDELASADSRIIAIHQSNQGAIGARCTGMQYPIDAQYYTFADADDCLPPYALELLLKKISDNNADVACGYLTRFNKWNIKFKTERPALLKTEAVYERESDEWMKVMHSFFGVSTFAGYMHTKLYRQELIQKASSFKTPCSFFQEDIAFNLQIFLNCNRVVVMPDTVYYYRMGGYKQIYA